MTVPADLEAHLKSGATTVCRAWAVVRRDGTSYGFTDHDCELGFDGMTFHAESGMTAGTIQQATGLSVDNTDAVGALSHDALREEDIMAGRFDGAEVRAWLVNWADTDQRMLQFRGTLGEIKRANGAFQAELRGLTEALNQPRGLVYYSCENSGPVQGWQEFDPNDPGYFHEGAVETVSDRKLFHFAGLDQFADHWFAGGRFEVLSGAAQGLIGMVKNDRLSADGREIELWQRLGHEIAPGDMVRIEAGFGTGAGGYWADASNRLQFQCFPHIPGEDWQMGYPREDQPMDGGSLFK